MKKLNRNIAFTVTGTIILAIYLLFFNKNLSSETTLTFLGKDAIINLPFTVSVYWYLLLPIMILFYENYRSCYKEIVGLNEIKKDLSQRDAEMQIFLTNFISLSIIIAEIIFLMIFSSKLGPLSILVKSIFSGLITYLTVSFVISIIFSLFWLYSDNKNSPLPYRYKNTFIYFIKKGIYKNITFILGITIGFSFRFLIGQIAKKN